MRAKGETGYGNRNLLTRFSKLVMARDFWCGTSSTGGLFGSLTPLEFFPRNTVSFTAHVQPHDSAGFGASGSAEQCDAEGEHDPDHGWHGNTLSY
jgi:hypothetical protein